MGIDEMGLSVIHPSYQTHEDLLSGAHARNLVFRSIFIPISVDLPVHRPSARDMISLKPAKSLRLLKPQRSCPDEDHYALYALFFGHTFSQSLEELQLAKLNERCDGLVW